MSNHDQWHRREAALEARRNLAAGTLPDSSDGASEQDDDGAPLEEDSIEDPAEGSMRQAAVATTQAADREPLSQASSRWGSDNELANGSMQQASALTGVDCGLESISYSVIQRCHPRTVLGTLWQVRMDQRSPRSFPPTWWARRMWTTAARSLERRRRVLGPRNQRTAPAS